MSIVIVASAAPPQLLRVCAEVEFCCLSKRSRHVNSLIFMHGACLAIFQVTLCLQHVHDYYNTILRCCVLCHWYMFYGRLRFNVFLLYMLSFLCSLYFTCTLSEKTTIKMINQSYGKGAKYRETLRCSKYRLVHLYRDAIGKLTMNLARHAKSKTAIFTIGKYYYSGGE